MLPDWLKVLLLLLFGLPAWLLVSLWIKGMKEGLPVDGGLLLD